MKGNTGGLSTLGDLFRGGGGAWRGGNQADDPGGGGRAPCCSDANRYGGTGAGCSWNPLPSSFSQPYGRWCFVFGWKYDYCQTLFFLTCNIY